MMSIYDPRVAQKVFDHILEAEVTITQHKLLLLTPKFDHEFLMLWQDDALLKQMHRQPLEFAEKKEWSSKVHMPAAFLAAARIPPLNATIIMDPYEAILRVQLAYQNNPEDAIKVAAELNSFQAMLLVIDSQGKVKVILDLGCQIVAILEEVCMVLTLPYNLDIQLNMVLVNKGMDQLLGLAWNIPFLVGKITLYLQVHILQLPTYNILLGQPFDILTQSVDHNFHNENQTITIVNPNTRKKAMVLTILHSSYQFTEMHHVPKKLQEQVSGF